MNRNKPKGKPEVTERKDIQQRDDEIRGEDGAGPGSGAETARHAAQKQVNSRPEITTMPENP